MFIITDNVHVKHCINCILLVTQVKFPKNNFLAKKEQFSRLESLLPPRPALDENITDDVEDV